MRRRYVLAPEAALDLVQIWRYVNKESREDIADRVVCGWRAVVDNDDVIARGRTPYVE